MRTAKNTTQPRPAFTLIELIVVVAIILAIAALAAAFAPRVNDNTNLSRGVDTVEQTLLTAKVRAKRDGLATGVRFIQAPNDAANTFSQFQYIQQPDPLSGGWVSTSNTPGSVAYTGNYLTGGILTAASGGNVTFANVDFTLGGAQLLVQTGDVLEVRDGGVYLIGSVTNATTLQLTSATGYDAGLNIATPTTNYRILRQPRLLVGEPPVALPNNYAVDLATTVAWGGVNVNPGPCSGTLPEILFSPSGSVVGTNAGSGKLLMVVHDMTDTTGDPNRAGIVGVQARTGFIAAYSVGPAGNYLLFTTEGRTSGL